jgi:hypothetical protein
MSNSTEKLNEEQTESPFGQSENEHEFEAKAGFASRSVTGGKGPGVVSEENE